MVYAIKTPSGLMSTFDDIKGSFIAFVEREKAEEALQQLQNDGVAGEDSVVVIVN